MSTPPRWTGTIPPNRRMTHSMPGNLKMAPADAMYQIRGAVNSDISSGPSNQLRWEAQATIAPPVREVFAALDGHLRSRPRGS